MLRCIHCGAEYKEEFNKNQCTVCAEGMNLTNLYSTSIKNFSFKPSPLDIYKSTSEGSVYLKREDKNEYSGTFKDRKSVYVLHENHYFSLASSGNQALSLVKYKEAYNKPPMVITQKGSYPVINFTQLEAVINLFVSPHINDRKFKELNKYYKSISFTDKILSIDELIQYDKNTFNLTNGMDPIGASAYYSLAMELEEGNFDYILVPCGSGELYTALSCYFHLLRQKIVKPMIIPIQSKLKETDAIYTDFVASQPFIDFFKKFYGQDPYVIENETETLKSLQTYSDMYNCELSSAVVFEAYEKLKPKGKVCLIVTGVKK